MSIVEALPQDAAAPGPVRERRGEFYARARTRSLAPLWESMESLVPLEPRSPARPWLWRYRELRPFLLEACGLIDAEEAERRVLMLENPGIAGGARITGSLYAGVQVILPGETAPPHRHVASALRLVLEGSGGWTTVDGERTEMRRGDFIITPGWTWHGHGNDGDGPVTWLDCLDIHIVNLLDCGFREGRTGAAEAERPAGASLQSFGMGLLPLDADRTGANSPVFHYPYERAREALAGHARSLVPDPWHGHRLRYANPLNGDWPIASIATWARLLPAGFATRPCRSTDGTVNVVIEGRGHSIVGGERLLWSPGDIFVVPSWTFASHHPAEESVLFAASDRAVQEKLGIWREERDPAAG
ncbi:MAG: cupin domain-containing protein [Sphingomonas sp.]